MAIQDHDDGKGANSTAGERIGIERLLTNDRQKGGHQSTQQPKEQPAMSAEQQQEQKPAAQTEPAYQPYQMSGKFGKPLMADSSAQKWLTPTAEVKPSVTRDLRAAPGRILMDAKHGLVDPLVDRARRLMA